MTETVERMLPLYEAKMFAAYDHRNADVVRSATAAKRQKQPEYLTDDDHAEAQRVAMPGDWVSDTAIPDSRPWRLAFSRISSATNHRTFVSAGLPDTAIGDSVFLLDSDMPACLLAAFNTFVFDYVTRQKLSGLNVLFYIVRQLPAPNRTTMTLPAPWLPTVTTADWIIPRVLELTYTAWDMQPFAEDLCDTGAPFVWDPKRRFLLRAELDAAFFHLYGVSRNDADYILDTFPIVRRKDEEAHGEYRTKRVVLEIFDAMQRAADTGTAYDSILTPEPGKGLRHPMTEPSDRTGA